jgi:hypothetical protein
MGGIELLSGIEKLHKDSNNVQVRKLQSLRLKMKH